MCRFFVSDARTNSRSFGDKAGLLCGIAAGIAVTTVFTFGFNIPVTFLSVGFYLATTLIAERVTAPIASWFYRRFLQTPLLRQEAGLPIRDDRSDHSESDRVCPIC